MPQVLTYRKNNRPPLTTLILTWVLIMSLGSVSFAVVNGEQHLDNKQLDAVGAFSKTAWLGVQVGIGEPAHEHNWFGAATLISPRHIITARHLLPSKGIPKRNSMAVRFRRTPDGSTGDVEDGPDSFYHVRIMRWIMPKQGGDLVIGVLDSEVTHIKPMPILLDIPENKPFAGWIAGWGSTNRQVGASGPRRRLLAGPNILMRRSTSILLGWFEVERPAPSPSTPNNKDKPAPKRPKPQIKESPFAVPNMHDSGGAMLAQTADGRLALVGVITTYHGGVWLGHYTDDAKLPITEFASEVLSSDALQFAKVAQPGSAEAQPTPVQPDTSK